MALFGAVLLVHLGAGVWLAVNGVRWLGPVAVAALLVAVVIAHVVALRRLRRSRAARRAEPTR